MRDTTKAPIRCGTPLLFAATPSMIAPKRNQGVSFAKPLNAVSTLATPVAQNRRQPINPAAPYSITLVIQARIMKLEIAMAPFAACGMSKGVSQMVTGTTTQMIAKTARKVSEGSSIAAACGLMMVMSPALIGFPAAEYKEATEGPSAAQTLNPVLRRKIPALPGLCAMVAWTLKAMRAHGVIGEFGCRLRRGSYDRFGRNLRTRPGFAGFLQG